MLGRIPTLRDFHENGSIDVQLIFSNKALGSYHAFLAKYEASYQVRFSSTQEQMLRFVSQKLASGKRAHELLLLKLLVEKSAVSTVEYERELHEVSPRLPVAACSVRGVLSTSFLSGGQAQTFSQCQFLMEQGNDVELSDDFARALDDPEFRRRLMEARAGKEGGGNRRA